jgi:tRNA(Ile)-lysidine synthetase-like protein
MAGRGEKGLLARTWCAGDRVDPGTGRLKKVKDALMEAKLPTWRRRRSLIVADDRGPLGLLAPGRSWGHGAGANGWVWLEGGASALEGAGELNK